MVNQKKIKEQKRKYYLLNRESILHKQKIYRSDPKVKKQRSEYFKKWYANNRQQMLGYMRAYNRYRTPKVVLMDSATKYSLFTLLIGLLGVLTVGILLNSVMFALIILLVMFFVYLVIEAHSLKTKKIYLNISR